MSDKIALFLWESSSFKPCEGPLIIFVPMHENTLLCRVSEIHRNIIIIRCEKKKKHSLLFPFKCHLFASQRETIRPDSMTSPPFYLFNAVYLSRPSPTYLCLLLLLKSSLTKRSEISFFSSFLKLREREREREKMTSGFLDPENKHRECEINCARRRFQSSAWDSLKSPLSS